MLHAMASAVMTGMIALAAAVPYAAAQNYPAKPIRLIVPFAAGGSADILGRVFAQRAALGQPIVVENVAGATGTIALARAAKSAPDGYTLTTGATSTFVISPNINANLPYDPIKDFVPVAVLGMITSVLVVNGSLPVTSLSELVALAKANPGRLNYASLGIGSSHHLHGEQLRRAAGIDIVHVPYKGNPQALTALLAGEVQLFFFPAFVDSMSNLQNGRLRALGVLDPVRSPVAPDVPTLFELGYPFDAPTWHILVAPAGTPDAIVQRLSAEVQRITSLEEVKQILAKQGVASRSMAPEALRKYVIAQYAEYGSIIRKTGIQGN